MSSKRKVPPMSRTDDTIGLDPARDPQRIRHWSQVFMRAPYSLFAQPQYEQPELPEQMGSDAFGFPM